eukprot:11172305-Lingulodinium_polyedra.AAC.1
MRLSSLNFGGGSRFSFWNIKRSSPSRTDVAIVHSAAVGVVAEDVASGRFGVVDVSPPHFIVLHRGWSVGDVQPLLRDR